MAEPRATPRPVQAVVASCTATDCTYNENRECHAAEINVRKEPQGVICATYEPEAPPPRP